MDQLNDLTASRKLLTGNLLFGNIDPVATLSQGNENEINEAVLKAKEVGVDAIWPGCDLVPQTPIENLRVFASAAQGHVKI